jgi:type III secretion protein V
VPIFRGLNEREFLVNDTPSRLSLLNVKGRSFVNPANGNECAVVEETGGLAELCQKAGLTTWDAEGYAVLAASGLLRRHASAFIVLHSVEHDLELVKSSFPALIACVRERFSLDQVAQILRYLLEEEISLRDLRKILEAMLAVKATLAEDLSKFIVFTPYVTLPCPARNVTDVKQLSAAHYGECVRMRLRRYISHKYTRGSSSLVVYLLDPAIESRVMEATDRPVTDGEREKILQAIFEEVGSLPQSTRNPVILTTLEARRPFRDLIEFEFPYLSVLSYQELSPEMNIQPIARISMDK